MSDSQPHQAPTELRVLSGSVRVHPTAALRRLRWVSFACFVSIYVLAFGYSRLGPAFNPVWTALRDPLLFMFAASPIPLLASWVLPRLRPTRPGTIVATPQGIALELSGRVKFIPRDSIESQLVIHPGAELSTLELTLRNGDVVTLQVRDQQAREILSASHLGPLDRRLKTVLDTGGNRLLRGALYVMAAFTLVIALSAGSLPVPTQAMLSIEALLFFLGGWALRPTTVTVGSDGVRIERGGKRHRFIAYNDIKTLSAVDNHMALTPLGGDKSQSLGLTRGVFSDTRKALAERVAAIVERAEDARTRAGDQSAESLAWSGELARNGRSLERWVSDLRALVMQAGDYRRRSLGRDELVRVVLDPEAPAAERVAAAVALRSADPSAARERIRAAAEGAADAPLREALEYLGGDSTDDRGVERALARVAPEA